MAFDFSKAKALVRRKVHEIFGVQAFYKDDTLSEPIEIRARWHDKIIEVGVGDLNNEGYAETLEGAERIVFLASDARNIDVRRGGQVWFPSWGAGMGASLGSAMGGQDVSPPKFILQVKRPNTGPVEEVWEATRV
jgi:hypothetical protein